MTGASDGEVFRKAQQLQATLVTNDQGFGDIRAYPPSSHHGIIVLKMEPDPQQYKRFTGAEGAAEEGAAI
jgi:hypothetical protein